VIWNVALDLTPLKPLLKPLLKLLLKLLLKPLLKPLLKLLKLVAVEKSIKILIVNTMLIKEIVDLNNGDLG